MNGARNEVGTTRRAEATFGWVVHGLRSLKAIDFILMFFSAFSASSASLRWV